MKQLYFISITTDNTLRVLQRVASVFSRNRINIEQLNVFETHVKKISHFNVAIYLEDDLIENIIKQLKKIIELHDIHARTVTNSQAA